MNNQTKIELLIDLVKGMEFRDDAQLEAFLAQASVTIRNVFGWSGNKYWPYFENIRFKPASFFASDYEYQKSWRRGKRQMIDLLSSMLSDPNLEEMQLGGAQQNEDIDDEEAFDEEVTQEDLSSEDATSIGDTSIKKEVEKILKETEFETKENSTRVDDNDMDVLLESLNKTIEDFKKTVVEDLVKHKNENEREDKYIENEEMGNSNSDFSQQHQEESADDNISKEGSVRLNNYDVPDIDEEVESFHQNFNEEKSEEGDVHEFSALSNQSSAMSETLQQPVLDNADDTMSITRERVFLVPGQDDHLNTEVYRFLSGNNIHLVVADDPYLNRRSIAEQFNEFNDIKYAIVLLSGDHYLFPKTQSAANAHLVTNQNVAFQLGYLVGRLGRERVLGLYHEEEKLKLPTAFFDVFYASLDNAMTWKTELKRRLHAVGLTINRQTHQIVN